MLEPGLAGWVGTWPAKNWMLWPELRGREAELGRTVASLKAMVADLVSEQEQKEPALRVVGLPSWEQAAQTPLLLSQRVRAIQGWSGEVWGDLVSVEEGD